jgi:hypothetical protein
MALVILFVAAPGLIRSIWRIPPDKAPGVDVPVPQLPASPI